VIKGFDSTEKERIRQLIEKYHLTASIEFDKEKVWALLKMDKKRVSGEMNFILLNKIGEAIIQPIPMQQLESLISQSL
jgi:3-dehydroquinate synthase